MKTIFIILVSFLLFGCNSSGEVIDPESTATLTIFHSNDIFGYVDPCG